jgi:hypothetical protein
MSQALALLAPRRSLIDDWAREFTTKQFIENCSWKNRRKSLTFKRSASARFSAKLRQRPYGLIIPRLLRATGKAQWAGYVHDAAEDDGLGVPAKWRKVRVSA